MISDAKQAIGSLIRTVKDGVERTFYGRISSRQGIAGIFSSGAWIVPATVAATGLRFREDIGNLIGKSLGFEIRVSYRNILNLCTKLSHF